MNICLFAFIFCVGRNNMLSLDCVNKILAFKTKSILYFSGSVCKSWSRTWLKTGSRLLALKFELLVVSSLFASSVVVNLLLLEI